MSVGFLLLFLILAAVAVVGAWRMIFSHHPVHSALYLVLNLCASAGIYLLLGAPFIAIVQVAVYAGAIMVLFLFVVMYLNLGLARDVADDRSRRLAAIGAASVLAALLIAAGAMSWSGQSAGLPPADLAAGEAAVATGRPSVPGLPAGTPEGETVMRHSRAAAATGMSRVEEIGIELFSRYALPFEVASVLLLVAMIGILVIARPELQREQESREEASG